MTSTGLSPWKTRKERERDREMKREAVLRAAARAFNEQGFHKTSLDDVAERLNVSKPTIYYYVRSKDEILFECVRIGLERLDAASRTVLPGGTGLARLIALWTEYARIVTEDFGRCLILVGEDPLPVETRRQLRALKSKIDHRFRSVVEDGIADGSIRACDPKLIAFAGAGALSWIARWYNHTGPLDVDTVARQLIDVLVHGIANPPAAAGALAAP
ncbi:TetR family transcriptional regulator [Chelatococcus daeguensis]|uniref:TetR family transcriptional regulator n=2 Tax=Chelatococcus TaxID=28209 RepID=A0AAC9NZR6_9HYPH|nr:MULTISPECIES: TetR/AcrR family transcriptional regulator [Chelatococcus]APF38899.1 TetR family transcriptional regulator [Chelatococcus daeguensis]KZE28315.1 TetR family transcriptional regulator [Chelatococcus daeguensis]MBM3084548.1 TetR family transcriptional regulator [Chelatococcus daeguensis]CUA88390.1 transcriptional regulator, TetR family [Chelatococcus sambhunathii]